MEHPDRIFLRDHVLTTEIGAFQSERGVDQRLRFNLTVDLRDAVSGAGDHVDHILSYDVLTQAVDTALADQRYNLVETLAERIAAEVLAHPRAARIEVIVEKLDRGPGALGVSIIRHQGRVEATGICMECGVRIHDAHMPVPQGAVVIVPASPASLRAQGRHARRITLLALDQAAWALADQLNLEVAATRTELDAAMQMRTPVVWAPAGLAADAPEAGETPETLGLWMATRLGARWLELPHAPADPLPPLPEGLTLVLPDAV
ncbi:dihydroneopterin aldolase [Paracoccus sp. (in: a-proteobacteria)]|uniref:dihydroneopterin aldolase n=1 Tax=Paracoccus sp. TaxID=267 RepID=UPI00396CB88F